MTIRVMLVLAGRDSALVNAAAAQNVDAGRQAFVTRCASCHGTDGNGGELGPAIAARAVVRTDEELRGVLRTRLSGRRDAAVSDDLTDVEASDLIAFVRTLRPRNARPDRAPVSR